MDASITQILLPRLLFKLQSTLLQSCENWSSQSGEHESTVFWNVTLFGLVDIFRLSSEVFVNISHPSIRHIPEGINFISISFLLSSPTSIRLGLERNVFLMSFFIKMLYADLTVPSIVWAGTREYTIVNGIPAFVKVLSQYLLRCAGATLGTVTVIQKKNHTNMK